MSIEIKTKKVILANKEGFPEGREILSIKMLEHQDLPFDYIKIQPSCWYHKENGQIWNSSGHMIFGVGSCMSEGEFRLCDTYLRKCGENLTNINEKIRAKEKTWYGEETFVI